MERWTEARKLVEMRESMTALRKDASKLALDGHDSRLTPPLSSKDTVAFALSQLDDAGDILERHTMGGRKLVLPEMKDNEETETGPGADRDAPSLPRWAAVSESTSWHVDSLNLRSVFESISASSGIPLTSMLTCRKSAGSKKALLPTHAHDVLCVTLFESSSAAPGCPRLHAAVCRSGVVLMLPGDIGALLGTSWLCVFSMLRSFSGPLCLSPQHARSSFYLANSPLVDSLIDNMLSDPETEGIWGPPEVTAKVRVGSPRCLLALHAFADILPTLAGERTPQEGPSSSS